MKSLYIISIKDANGRMVSYSIVATSMAAAITKAQTEAGVSSDPESTQRMATIDFEL